MAMEMDPYFRRLLEEHEDNPAMVAGIARQRAYMWEGVANGEFPLHTKLFSEVESKFSHPSFDFYPSEGKLIVDDSVVGLTITETRMLTVLFQRINWVVQRQTLLRAALHYEDDIDEKTVNVHISHIRRKIRQGREIDDPIEAVRGLGYRLVDPRIPNGFGNGNPHP